MKKAIFLTILFSGLLSLSLLFSVADTASALECTQDSDCANESFCYSGTGLSYGYICCESVEDCGVEWLIDECVMDANQGRIDASCEQSCCDSYCEETYGTNYVGVCFENTNAADTCSCTEGEGEGEGLSAPILSSPQNGASNISLTPRLSWGPVAGAEGFIVNVRKEGSGIWGVAITGISITVPVGELIGNTSYTWRVRSCADLPCVIGSTETSGWSSEQGFTTGNFGGSPRTPGVPGTSSGGECPAGQICNPLAYDTVEEIIAAVGRFLFQIGMVLAPVMLIIAGVMFVTSAGSPGGVQKAKSLALYTIIGLAVILLASGLIAVLQSILGSS